ncbi:MAG: chromosome segregation protein SMC, partial [Methylococcales bacterium]
KGKITSLELLQQHAMGKDNKNLSAWLESMNLNNNQRLAEFLDVDAGWDTAVETALGRYLEAICITNPESVFQGLDSLDKESVTLFNVEKATKNDLPDNQATASLLLNKVKAPWDIGSLLSNIYCADNNEAASTLAGKMSAHESAITPEGIWFGSNWLKITHTKDSKVGILQREKELRLLKIRQEELTQEIYNLEDQLSSTELELKEAEILRESLQQQDNKLGAELSSKSAEFSAYSTRWAHQQRRLEQIANDLEEIMREINENTAIMVESRHLQEEAEAALEQQEDIKLKLEEAHQRLQSQQNNTEQTVNEAMQQTYSLKAKIDALRSSESSTIKQIDRLKSQHQQSIDWLATLDKKRQQTLSPLNDEKEQLKQQSLEKDKIEAKLKTQRQLQESIEAEITQLSEQQTYTQRTLEKQKEGLDSIRFELQECKVRQQTINEQLKEIDANAEHVLRTLPEQAEESYWKSKVDELSNQIERLGTINLTAIEEYKAQSERMNFLNEQHADLIEALQILDQAISKIDKESRLRFKETFDKINTGLQEKFPKLFGGGQAYLELTEQDLLESGVNIIARPPGKRNSSIHLLSGGEKALTAVALVFSIFELNPAPFCLLDEVDAPLDDANVGRFSKMVEEMSSSVQFLYISHNKVTMEIAQQLAGVTMKEPGVSRMVAVDIEEAVNLAEI